MLLTASSRPSVILSLPLRSNSWLSASTISRACKATGAAAAGAGAALTGGAATGAAAGAGAVAGAPNRLTPQLEQNASPAGLAAPHDGQICVPALAAAGAAAGAGAAA